MIPHFKDKIMINNSFYNTESLGAKIEPLHLKMSVRMIIKHTQKLKYLLEPALDVDILQCEITGVCIKIKKS